MSPKSKSSQYNVIAFPALVVYAVAAFLTWRDISRRADAEVRGGKTVWRIASALNLSGSAAYWIFGRRPTE